MNQPTEDFLNASLPLPGIIACAIRLPDRSLVTRRDGEALTIAHVEQTVARLALATENFKRHHLETHTLCWTFDQARIHLTRRPDNALLFVFSENRPGQPPNEDAMRLLQSFRALPQVLN